MRKFLTLALTSLALSACADDADSADGDTGSSSGGSATTTMSTTAPMTTTMSGSGDTTAGTAGDATGTTDGSSGPVPDGTSSDDGGSSGSSSDGGTTTGSDSGMTTGSSSDGGMTTSGSSDGGMTTSGSSSDGGMTTSGSSSDGGMTTSGSSSDGGMATSGSSGSDGGMMTTGGSSGGDACIEIECGGTVYECGDCIDNDGDGVIDGFDVECISPCDDDEGSFATGIPGDNIDLCHQDCFFDGNSGGGDDGCNWWLACDPLDPDNGQCSIPGGQTCPMTQPPECIENCQVPNGCDCFGCCTVNIDGEDVNILIGADDCALDNLAACPECTQVEACTDPCDPTDCELCFGETELPPGCEDPTCPDMQQPCEVHTDCPVNWFCQTGCCEEIPL